jgi:hypothetical protein
MIRFLFRSGLMAVLALAPGRLLQAAETVAAESRSNAAADGQKTEHLGLFFVRETRISDFGFSVVTNFGVVWGGRIKWLRVGQVAPGSAAALAQLNPEDEIFMVDGQPRSGMSRETMLKIFFQRKLGDRVSLEVRDVHTRRLRLVRLQVNARTSED